MRKHAPRQKKIQALVAVTIALASFDVFIWHAVLADDGSSVREGAAASAPSPIVRGASTADGLTEVGVPVRVRIPSIDVDAAIEKVAVEADGSMGVPEDPLDTGWLEIGPRPGETGSSAITGHVDWVNGATAVFADLHKVRVGDRITVEDDEGGIIAFLVRDIRQYDAAAEAVEVFSSNDGRSHLNLITCDGAWDASARQYSERLVVFADRE